MAKYILAGVGTGIGVDSAGAIVVSGNTYTESSISIEVSSEDIRGGEANGLIGKYFHDSVMNATLTDALFSLEYLSLKMGAAVTVGSNGIELESLTVANDQITVAGVPVALEQFGVIGWVAATGSEDWKKVTFEGKVASVKGLGFANGDPICVKYCADKIAARQFVVPTNIIPSEIAMILQFPLFRAGTGEQSLTNSYKVGTLEIKIPRFLPDPSAELSLTSSGAATVSFTGSALPYKATTGCHGGLGDYAIFTEIIDGASWTDNLTALAVDNADIQLGASEETTLQVWGIYGGNNTMTTKPIDNANLTFTSTESSKATVDNKGVVKGVASGAATIKVVATGTEIEAFASVTVS